MGERLRILSQVGKILDGVHLVSPEDAMSAAARMKKRNTPRGVIKMFNTLLEQGTDQDGFCNIMEQDVSDFLTGRGIALKRGIDKQDIMEIYRAAGWDVEFMQSANTPYFKFKDARKKPE